MVNKQFKLNNQPCIIPKIISTDGTKCFSGTRRQLHFNLDLENVGDSPALSIYVVGYFKLKHTQTNDNLNTVEMDYLPDYIFSIGINGSEKASIRFETKEIKLLIKDLEVSHRLNTERIRTDASQAIIHGTDIVIEIYYKNVIGQWFKVSLVREIAWLINTSIDSTKRISNNLNEYTIPPKKLYPDISFTLQLISKDYLQLI